MITSAAWSFPIAIAAMVVGMTTSSAQAYLDPGTGSMILQLALGGVAGAMVIGKLYLKRASDFFRQFSRRKHPG